MSYLFTIENNFLSILTPNQVNEIADPIAISNIIDLRIARSPDISTPSSYYSSYSFPFRLQNHEKELFKSFLSSLSVIEKNLSLSCSPSEKDNATHNLFVLRGKMNKKMGTAELFIKLYSDKMAISFIIEGKENIFSFKNSLLKEKKAADSKEYFKLLESF